LKKITLTSFLIAFALLTGESYAGNSGIGVHWGYGTLIYEEATSGLGTDIESELRMKTMLFGVSGEYSFKKPDHFFAAIVTDWVVGIEDKEDWNFDNVRIQSGDANVDGQFYDVRFGYKDSFEKFYYSMYKY